MRRTSLALLAVCLFAPLSVGCSSSKVADSDASTPLDMPFAPRDMPFPVFDFEFGSPDLGVSPDPDAGSIDIDAGSPGVCGDGVLTAPEQCDDGNLDARDGCDAACTVEADVCPGSEAPVVLIAGSNAAGDTSVGTSDTGGSCGGSTAGEDAFVFTVYTVSDVVLTTDLPPTVFNAALYVRRECAARGSELSCASVAAGGDTLTLESLAPGTYFAFVDGVGGAVGTYELGMTITPRIPAGGACDPLGTTGVCIDGAVCTADASGEYRCRSAESSCVESAVALTLGAAATAGTTVGAEDRYASACSRDGDAPERVFRVSVPAGGTRELVVTAAPTNFAADMFDIVLTVESTCGVTASSAGCSDTGGAESTETVVVDAAAGDYFILVDGFGTGAGMFTAGEFEVAARLRDILGAGESCDPTGELNRCVEGLACGGPAGAEICVDPLGAICDSAVAATLGVAVTATLGGPGIVDDLEPGCGTDAGTDEDLYYVDLAAPGFVTARARGMLAGTSTVYIRGADSCGPAVELACDTTGGARLEAITGVLPIGRYYVVVDGSGTYNVTVTVGTVVAAGAACDATSTTARCADGTACLGAVCRAVTVIDDVAPNASFCDAQGPSSGDTLFRGTLTTTGATDLDTLEIRLDAPATLTISTSNGFGGCTADTLLQVFDGVGSTCAELDAAMPMPSYSDDNSGLAMICSTLTTALLPAGSYYVRVRRSGAATPGGAYEILVDVN